MTHNRPKPGSDEIQKAYEECWFPSSEESPRTKRLAFLGDTLSEKGELITELFSVAFPIDFHRNDPSLAGTIDRRPAVPQGTLQRRLTRTQSRRFPGVRGTRHWPQVRPDGTSIALLMLDDHGIAQLFLIDASDGSWHPLTKLPTPVSSAFTWSPDGRSVAFLSDRSVYLVDASSGHSERITSPATLEPRPEACVFSPDGSKIAYVAPVQGANDRSWNQIFVVELD